MKVDYLIIGGGIAGVTAAETIRTKDAVASIRIYGDEKHALYSRVLLPHVVRGRTPEERAYLKTPAQLAEKGIEFVIGAGVQSVEPVAHEVTLTSGEIVQYGKLLIATGGAVRPLAVPGAAEAGVLAFQTMDDARKLIAAGNTAKAVVYGGGFIGLELVMSFLHHGASVTAVVRGDGFFSRVLDAGSRERISAKLKAQGVEIITGSEIASIEMAGALKKVKLNNGQEITCTAVAAGIGIVPNVAFLTESGIGVKQGILTDEYLRTDTPDVYAAGDVAESLDLTTGERRIIGNWQNAMFQGKTVGANMAAATVAEQVPFTAITTYAITVLDLPITFVGAADLNADERIVRETPKGATLQLFIKNGRAVGATCVGPFSERAAVMKILQSPQLPENLDAALAG